MNLYKEAEGYIEDVKLPIADKKALIMLMSSFAECTFNKIIEANNQSGEVGDRLALIDALRYYADEQNYDENGAPGNFVGTASGDVWELDEGKIAEEALKLIKK